jgi:hypothetical protein
MKNSAEGWEREHDELIRLLRVSNSLAFKIWKLEPTLKYLGFAILTLASILILVAAFWGPEIKIITLRSLIVMALSAGTVYVLGQNLVRLVRYRDTLHRILLGIGMCCGGVAVAWVHLRFFDRLYLAVGRVNRIVKRASRSHLKHTAGA